MSLVIYQDEASKWGPNPLRAMIEAHKNRRLKWAREAAEIAKAHDAAMWDKAVAEEQERRRRQAEEAAERLKQERREEAVKAASIRIPYTKMMEMRGLVREIANAYGYEPESIYARQRFPPSLVVARIVCVYVVCTETNWPLSKVGVFFNRDHSTIVHSRNRALDMLANRDHQILWLLRRQGIVQDDGVLGSV